jgi:hypothetical protein
MYSAITTNKRNTIIIMTVFVIIIGIIGLAIGAMNGDYNLGWRVCWR